MSIRMALLGLAAQSPGRGADLCTRFLEQTGGTWPLNLGQVYTTLDRLIRDGLVEELEPQSENAKRATTAPPKRVGSRPATGSGERSPATRRRATSSP
jgi:DNA-binding PadR family transcriptional regulator